ncbi:C-C motif chemokine 19-like [Gouania willdenowi]|uniref:C-C motif chemokine 19-like n=1 Tax=Gouania willdenowi TaxID=441366 RepID=A0A8C5HW53_GOUWI|nr:C-C motif chemokine 19-like [Gouania willdenowi]
MTSRLSVLILLGVLCFVLTTGNPIMDCCLKTTQKKFSFKLVQSYKIQEAAKGCEISATVIFTKGGRKLCLAPPKGNPFIQALIEDVNRARGKQWKTKQQIKV